MAFKDDFLTTDVQDRLQFLGYIFPELVYSEKGEISQLCCRHIF